MVLHALRLVVRGKGKDEAHDGFEVSLQHLLARDGVHPDLLAGHELQHPLEVLPHPLQGLRLVDDPRDLFPSCKE